MTKLRALNDLLRAITARLVDFFHLRDRWSEETFFDLLLEAARRGRCEGELTGAVRNVLAVFALSESADGEEDSDP